MTTAIIPVLAAMYLGSTFNLVTYQKGNADVFDEDTLKGNLQVIDRSFTRSQYKLVETSSQARDFLDVSGALSLRIKRGDIAVDGAGSYLKDTANRQKFVELLVRVQHETVTETIPSYLSPRTDWMTMSPEMVGSHFVRSITYGGELIASLRLKASNREQREKIKAAVAANLQLTGTFDINANGSFDKLKQDLTGMYNLEIIVSSTKSQPTVPQSIEELMKLVEDYPKEINAINNGKGKAIKAELYPLSSLRKDFPDYLPNSALIALLDDVETKYDDIRTVMRDIVPWLNNFDGTDEEEEIVTAMYGSLQNAQAAFNKAISGMDVSMGGSVDQFKKAFNVYGSGKDNVPNRFQRWFWKIRHTISKEPIVWEKPSGSGATYVHWGSNQCPTPPAGTPEVELLYSGYASGNLAKSWAGGSNYECLRDQDPQLSRALNMQPKPALLDAVDYRSLQDPDKAYAIQCAACLVHSTVAVKNFYARTSCPKHWRAEYSGVTMADSSSNVDSELMCLNGTVSSDVADTATHLAKLNPVWMDCAQCGGERIVPCIVCSYDNKAEL